MKVEVCTSHIDTVSIAEKAGADRIELCSAISLGGITPSAGLIQAAVAQSSLPIQCLIRPRSGDFIYTDAEFHIILDDIRKARALGVAGIVIGFMTQDNRIDWNQLEQAMAVAGSLEVCFHRAFDLVVDPEQSLERLIEMGVNRILCSGQAEQAAHGIATLIGWKNKAAGNIEIQPGGGINPKNCSLFVQHQFPSLHLSALDKQQQNTSSDTLDNIWQDPIEVANFELLKQVVATCH